jgi:hypothetical protein
MNKTQILDLLSNLKLSRDFLDTQIRIYSKIARSEYNCTPEELSNFSFLQAVQQYRTLNNTDLKTAYNAVKEMRNSQQK